MSKQLLMFFFTLLSAFCLLKLVLKRDVVVPQRSKHSYELKHLLPLEQINASNNDDSI